MRITSCQGLGFTLHEFAGYGGALSIYSGLFAGRMLLHVSFFKLSLERNVFTRCSVSVSSSGGNAYGGGASVYMGGYASVISSTGAASAETGDTVVRNVSVTLRGARFTSCSSRRSAISNMFGGNVYGGSFSFYIGAYSWSFSSSSSSSSTSGATSASGVSVSVSDAPCSNCIASVSTNGGNSRGASSYGGSMSAVYIGAYSWSESIGGINFGMDIRSSSSCGDTRVGGLFVSITRSSINHTSAISSKDSVSFDIFRTDSLALIAQTPHLRLAPMSVPPPCNRTLWLMIAVQAFGGAISVMIGPYVRSEIGTGDSTATSGDTECSNCRVIVTDISIRNSSALSQTTGELLATRLTAMFTLTLVSGGASRGAFV